MTCQNAQQFCFEKQSKLVDIDSLDENNFVANLVESKGSSFFWVGLNDSVEENIFRASDGSYQYYFNWADDEPNNHNEIENCVIASKNESWKWNDIQCTVESVFVCEKNEGESLQIYTYDKNLKQYT